MQHRVGFEGAKNKFLNTKDAGKEGGGGSKGPAGAPPAAGAGAKRPGGGGKQ